MIHARLDEKLSRIRAGQYTASDFIIADAKDGDMAFGIAAPGPVAGDTSGLKFKNRTDYLTNMTKMAQSGLIDILLCSASSSEILHQRQLFTSTDVTSVS